MDVLSQLHAFVNSIRKSALNEQELTMVASLSKSEISEKKSVFVGLVLDFKLVEKKNKPVCIRKETLRLLLYNLILLRYFVSLPHVLLWLAYLNTHFQG